MTTHPTPHECLKESISRWEGEFQDMAEDSGNWVNCHDGRRLIGTMRGVTPYTLAQHLDIDPCSLTAESMRETVTVDMAAEIGMKGFYRQPGFDGLDWSPLVWIAVDIGWGSGPAKGVRMLQELIGASPDGVIGPQTRDIYAQYVATHDMRDACAKLAKARRDFYTRISRPGTPNNRFRQGWYNRADYYSPSNADWWGKWADWKPSGAVVSGKPIAPPAPTPATRGQTAATAGLAGAGLATGGVGLLVQIGDAAPILSLLKDNAWAVTAVVLAVIGLYVWRMLQKRKAKA